jgi:hypothetical protein
LFPATRSDQGPATVADLAMPYSSDTTGSLMGQLRTANNRRNRALRVPPTLKELPKAVPKPNKVPVKKKPV